MKNKKIFVIIGLIILAGLIIYILLKNEDEVIKKDNIHLKLSTDYNDYLLMNTLINDYFLNLSLENESDIKGIIDINGENSSYKEIDTYYVEKVYYVNLDENIYYYISGRKMIYDYDTSKMTEIKNDCYLINVYKPSYTYRITKINDIENYYNENDLIDKVNIKVNDYNDFSKYHVAYRESELYDTYINYFKDLLFVNYSEAYEMLDTSFKNKIGPLETFNKEREKIYKKLNNIVESFAITGENANKTYIIILSNETKITMTEDGIMNVKYKIENY